MSELLSIKKNQLINSKRDSDLIFNQYTTLEKNNSIKFDKLIKKYDDFKMTMMEKLKEEEEEAKEKARKLASKISKPLVKKPLTIQKKSIK